MIETYSNGQIQVMSIESVTSEMSHVSIANHNVSDQKIGASQLLLNNTPPDLSKNLKRPLSLSTIEASSQQGIESSPYKKQKPKPGRLGSNADDLDNNSILGNDNNDTFSFIQSAPLQIFEIDTCTKQNQIKKATSLKMIRSNGEFRPVIKEASLEFPYDSFYSSRGGKHLSQYTNISNNANEMVHSPQVSALTETSSSIVLGTPSDESGNSAYIQNTPIPYEFHNQQNQFSSPHIPVFEPLAILPKRQQSIRNTLLESQNYSIGHSDYFSGYMEERMMRWRPSDSQYNVDATMNGNHPYQSPRFDFKRDIKTNTIFNSMSKWFTKDKSELIRNDSNIISASNSNSDTTTAFFSALQTQQSPQPLTHFPPLQPPLKATPSEHFTHDSPDFNKIINSIKLKANSSNSLIPSPMFNGSPFNSMAVVISPPAGDSFVTDEPSKIPEPMYTPKAIPFNQFDLHFDKHEEDFQLDYNNNRRQHTNLLNDDYSENFEGEIRDVFDDIGDIFVSCTTAVSSVLNRLC